METDYDVIVMGLGAMGSATVYQLAKKGVKVLGIDQFNPPHAFGSTHGDTRITRQAIGEGEMYVPLVLRSYEIWDEIEKETGVKLLTRCGGLILGNEKSEAIHGKMNFIQQTIQAAKKHGIKHEELSTEQIHQKFPTLQLRGTEKGYYEFDAGYLKPELCITTQLELAKKYGAEIHTNESVDQFIPMSGSTVEVRTNKGVYRAKKIIVSAGPWVGNFFPEYADLFKVYRQVLYWFDIERNKEIYTPDKFPIYIWDFGNGEDVYGFPAVDGPDGGLKIASEDYEVITNPNEVDRAVKQEEVDKMYNTYVRPYFPDLGEKCLRSVACLYTVTPDSDFIIDTHPKDEQIIIVSPCSGHGFKHSAAIGEVVAQLAMNEKTSIDITPFSLKRFARKWN